MTINIENKTNNDLLTNDETALAIYVAIQFLKHKIKTTDFPMDRKVIYDHYFKFCTTWPWVHPLKANTFSLITNVFFITTGYFVLNVRTSNKKHMAMLKPIEPRNQYTHGYLDN